MLKVLFASAEAAPFAKTGGLADVVGTLPRALNKSKVDVRIIVPLYGDIPETYRNRMRLVATETVQLGWRRQYCGLFEMEYEEQGQRKQGLMISPFRDIYESDNIKIFNIGYKLFYVNKINKK